MSKETENTNLRRLRNRYRLVVMNDDTYEEVATFKLSRMTVYIGLCSVFVLLVGLTVALLTLTPLKYYVPGYGSLQGRKELQELKMKTDSLDQALQQKDQYLDNIKKVLGGSTTLSRDTATLNIPKPEISND